MRVRIYWRTNNRATIEKIREKFNLPRYMSVNGETEGSIKDCDLHLLEECERRGYIQIRQKWE